MGTSVNLSILIPTTMSRLDMSVKLYNSLVEMVGDKSIEVLMLFDDKKRTIGGKREALKNISNGKYFMFNDSDDQILDLEEIYKATFLDVDVIDFDAICQNDDKSTYIVQQKLNNPVEHNTKDGKYLDCKRPPFTNCAWHNKFKKYPFPEISYGEDWVFVEQCLNVAMTEHYIPKVLFSYNFDKNITEASTESNAHWQNPNQ